MRSVALARTLGVGGFASLSEVGAKMANAMGGPAALSQASYQHTKAQSSTPEAGDGPGSKEIPDPFDLEFDRFNGGAMADALKASMPPPDPLDRPVDLEYELDRDDPEAVDLEALYESPDEEEEMLLAGKEVDLDDEYDLMHDHVVGVTEPSPSESRPGTGGTVGVHPTFEAVKSAGTGAPPPPQPGVGA